MLGDVDLRHPQIILASLLDNILLIHSFHRHGLRSFFHRTFQNSAPLHHMYIHFPSTNLKYNHMLFQSYWSVLYNRSLNMSEAIYECAPYHEVHLL